MKRLTVGLMLIGTIVQNALSADIDTAALKQIQGEWAVEEWTGYKPLALYEGYVAPSKGNDYSGSELSVSGTNTIWQLRITDNMKGLMLGLFTEGKGLTAKKEGDIQFYTDKATIVALQSGNPGKLRFASARSEGSGAPNEYAAIWSLQNDRLVICKAKNQGEKCSQTLEIPQDDFFNTRIVLRRTEKEKVAQKRVADPRVSVREDDTKKVSTYNPARLDQPEMVRASHILLITHDPKTSAELPPEQKAAKRKQIEDLLKRARAGEDFAKMVKEYSEDPGSKEKGGEYKFSRGQMVPAFEAAAFSLKKAGDISDVVTTVYGYHIIKLVERIPKTETKPPQEPTPSAMAGTKPASPSHSHAFPENWREAEQRLAELLGMPTLPADQDKTTPTGGQLAYSFKPKDPNHGIAEIERVCGAPHRVYGDQKERTYVWGRFGCRTQDGETIDQLTVVYSITTWK